MSTACRVDAKGKVFTTRITKQPIRVLVQSGNQAFVGTAYVRTENRLLDELNDPANRFLALTDVRVYGQGSETLLYTASFLALNKDHIVAIVPLEELPREQGLGVWMSSLKTVLRECQEEDDEYR